MSLATSKSRRRKPVKAECQELAGVVFATELGWMALAHRGDVVDQLVVGYATRKAAVDALERQLGDVGETLLVDEMVPAASGRRAGAEAVVDQLCRFAAGEAVKFSRVAIDTRYLTPFARRVVAACRRIPRGQTRSYGQLASIAGVPGAARAVGTVMAKNRVPLVVPCHRVLASGGKIGGYSSPQGLAMKRRLLAMESCT